MNGLELEKQKSILLFSITYLLFSFVKLVDILYWCLVKKTISLPGIWKQIIHQEEFVLYRLPTETDYFLNVQDIIYGSSIYSFIYLLERYTILESSFMLAVLNSILIPME